MTDSKIIDIMAKAMERVAASEGKPVTYVKADVWEALPDEVKQALCPDGPPRPCKVSMESGIPIKLQDGPGKCTSPPTPHGKEP